MTRRLVGLVRVLAVGVALVAALDPPLTTARRVQPEIALVESDSSSDAAVAARVARELSSDYTIVRGAYSGAAASVLVGDRLPAAAEDLAAPVFAVLPELPASTIALEAVQAPARAPLNARVPVTVRARIRGGAGRTVEVTLRSGGLLVDHGTSVVASNDTLLDLPLTFVPTATGAVMLRVTAEFAGEAAGAAADVLVDVREKRWAVLFFDARPSWMATFVRRAIERDARFVVSSRVVTSHNVSTDAGRPPASLGDPLALALFDAIVVGAPEALGPTDVGGLDAFLRSRGGGVLLLVDHRAAGPWQRLAGVTRWAAASAGSGIAIQRVAPGEGGLRATEVMWPALLPEGADVLAESLPQAGDTTQRRPVVWRSPVGPGRLVISGALDAWEFRDPAVAAFDLFWQTVIADAADDAPPLVDARVAQPLLAPGETTDVLVTVRDAALASLGDHALRASVGAAIDGPASSHPIRLWPEPATGQFRGSLRAPATPGTYEVRVIGNGTTETVPIIVASDVARVTPPARDLVRVWARAHGGRALDEAQLASLRPLLAQRIRPTTRRVTWHPMRSTWWLLPFVLLLGLEWWARRTRGER